MRLTSTFVSYTFRSGIMSAHFLHPRLASPPFVPCSPSVIAPPSSIKTHTSMCSLLVPRTTGGQSSYHPCKERSAKIAEQKEVDIDFIFLTCTWPSANSIPQHNNRSTPASKGKTPTSVLLSDHHSGLSESAELQSPSLSNS